MNARILFSLVAIFVGGEFSKAAEPAAVMGVGTASCAEFSKSYKRNPGDTTAVFMSWVHGFMSGWNAGAIARKEPPRDIGSKSIDQQELHIRSYCDGRPQSDITSAARDLYLSLPVRSR